MLDYKEDTFNKDYSALTQRKNGMDYSIIIPAYNAEKTIARAINSILLLSYSCEIIVVENGCTDNTSSIVKEIAYSHNCVKLINTSKGVSKARNEGLRAAHGEWAFFMDADDVWIGDFNTIRKSLEYNKTSDIVCFDYYKDEIPIHHNYTVDEQYHTKEVMNVLEWALSKPTGRMTVWAKAYNVSYLKDKNLLFNEDLSISEDSEFLVRALLASRQVGFSKTAVYRYCRDMESTIRSFDSDRTGKYISSLKVVQQDLNDYQIIREGCFRDFIIAHINLICVHDIFDVDLKLDANVRINMLKSLLKEQVFNNALKKLKMKDLTNINNIPTYLCKIGLYRIGGAFFYIRSKTNKRRRAQ